MRPPCEQNLRHLIPQFRAHLAVRLKHAGWSQTLIAKELGITQAAISGYLRVYKEKTPFTTSFFYKTVDTVVKGLLENNLPPNEVVAHICQLCLTQRIGGPLCSQHKKDIPQLESVNCNLCHNFPPSKTKQTSRVRTAVLTELADAFQELQLESISERLIPEVRSNLIYSIPNAQSLDDIAGFPGRITRIHNRIATITQPEFGGSTYTGKLLLAFQTTTPKIRAAFCLRSTEPLLHHLKVMKIPLITINSENENLEEHALIEKLKKISPKSLRGPIMAVHVIGHIGYESIIYLFGKNPQMLVILIKDFKKLQMNPGIV